MTDKSQLSKTPFAEEAEYVWPEGSFRGVIMARCLAFLADLLVVCILLAIAFAIFGILGTLTLGLLWPGALLSPFVALAYFTLTLGGKNSATPGMRWQNIELRTWRGGRPGYIQAAIQTVLFYVTVSIGTLLVLVVPFFNQRRRCLHDYLCGTVFVRSTPA